MLFRHPTLLALLLVALLPMAARADERQVPGSSRDRHHSAGGVTVGLPQIIALTAEKEVADHLRLQGNFGTAVAISSLSGRFIALLDGAPLQPYAFLGAGVFAVLAAAGDTPVAPYGWYGAGLRLEIDRVILFAEAGAITIQLLPDSEYSDSSPTAALGLLVEY